MTLVLLVADTDTKLQQLSKRLYKSLHFFTVSHTILVFSY